VRLVLGQDGVQMPFAEDQHAAGNSRRMVPTSRSQIAFMRGAWTAVRRILVVQEVDREDPGGWACRNCRHAGPERRGAESTPAASRISQTVDGATVRPSFVSWPWIRRYPHSGFSFARRTARRATLRTVGGRPGLRHLLVPYFFAASLRCQASSVAGVTGKTSLQRLRGMSRASAESQARSAGSYSTRPMRDSSGIGHSGELDLTHWQFINPELTVNLHRMAAGE
jgi:hypothetical protein